MKKVGFFSIWWAHLVLVVILAGTAWADGSARDPKWAQPVVLAHSENFYMITPELYRSAQPTAAAFKEYERFGIKSVINLRARHSDKKLLKETSLNLIEVPINTWAIDDEDVVAVLKLIQSQPQPVLVHCQHGADRTGTISAMYRMVFQGWSGEEALDELMNGGYGFHSIWKNIPKFIKEVNVEKIKSQVGR